METKPTVTPISINGKELYNAISKQRFIPRGVALSATNVKGLNIKDILSDDNIDLIKNTIIPKLVYLNANMIRVYQVDPNNSHSKVMQALAAKGIYVMVGLATPTYSIKQMTGEYSQNTFNHAARIIDEFQDYNNTLCFSVGNEVEFPGQQATNLKDANPSKTDSEIVQMTIALELKVAKAMRSFTRDVKNHITSNDYRKIPVGCAMQDGPQSSWGNSNPNTFQRGIVGTDIIAQYYSSGKESERMDYIGINTYRYVPNGPMSAYDGLATESSPLGVPVILTETGGLGSTPRTWSIVPQMYTRSELYPQLSGQVAFQMLEEGAGYGLFDVENSDGHITLKASKNGGAADLASNFATGAEEPLNSIATKPTLPTAAPLSFGSNPVVTVTWPTELFPLKTFKSATITVENFAQNEIQITQNGNVMGIVGPAISKQPPTSAAIVVQSNVSLSIQGNVQGNWDSVCYLPASEVINGITVKNDISWGSKVVCPISN